MLRLKNNELGKYSIVVYKVDISKDIILENMVDGYVKYGRNMGYTYRIIKHFTLITDIKEHKVNM